jgi:hypothetical protein
MPPVPGFVYRISIACHNHFIRRGGFILDLPNNCGHKTNEGADFSGKQIWSYSL